MCQNGLYFTEGRNLKCVWRLKQNSGRTEIFLNGGVAFKPDILPKLLEVELTNPFYTPKPDEMCYGGVWTVNSAIKYFFSFCQCFRLLLKTYSVQLVL